jgi:hypothetical protein
MYIKVTSSSLSRLNFLATRNIYNQDDIQEFLSFLSRRIKERPFSQENKKKIIKWFHRKKQGFKDYLAKNIKGHSSEFYKKIQRVTILPTDAPDWLVDKVESDPHYLSKEEVFKVRAPLKTDQDLVGKIDHIIDYFAWYIKENPSKTLVNVTWSHMLKGMEEWEKSFIVEETSSILDGEKLYVETNGMSWYELTDQESLDNEGSRMNHCVGGYCDLVQSNSRKIFSLRDSGNNPHVTVELDMEKVEENDLFIEQAKGKGNSSVSHKYADHLIDLLKAISEEYDGNEVHLSDEANGIGIFIFDGEYLTSSKQIPVDGELMDIELLSDQQIKDNAGEYPGITRVVDNPAVLDHLLRYSEATQYSSENVHLVPEGDVLETVKLEPFSYVYLHERYRSNTDIIDSVLESEGLRNDLNDEDVSEVFGALPKKVRDNPDNWRKFSHVDAEWIFNQVDLNIFVENIHKAVLGRTDTPDIFEMLDHRIAILSTRDERTMVMKLMGHPEFFKIFPVSLWHKLTPRDGGVLGEEMFRHPLYLALAKESISKGLNSFFNFFSMNSVSRIEELLPELIDSIMFLFRKDPINFLNSLFELEMSRSMSHFLITEMIQHNSDEVKRAVGSATRNGDIIFPKLGSATQDLFLPEIIEDLKHFLKNPQLEHEISWYGYPLGYEEDIFDEEVVHNLSELAVDEKNVERIFLMSPNYVLIKKIWMSSEKLRIKVYKKCAGDRSIFGNKLRDILRSIKKAGVPHDFWLEEAVLFFIRENIELLVGKGSPLSEHLQNSGILDSPKIQKELSKNIGHLLKKGSIVTYWLFSRIKDLYSFLSIPEVRKKVVDSILGSSRTWLISQTSFISENVTDSEQARIFRALNTENKLVELVKDSVYSGMQVDKGILKAFPDSTRWMVERLIENIEDYDVYLSSYPDILKGVDQRELFRLALIRNPVSFLYIEDPVVIDIMQDSRVFESLYNLFLDTMVTPHGIDLYKFSPFVDKFSGVPTFDKDVLSMATELDHTSDFGPLYAVLDMIPEKNREYIEDNMKNVQENF